MEKNWMILKIKHEEAFSNSGGLWGCDYAEILLRTL